MPVKSKKPCGKSGCPELVESGYCEKHKKVARGYDTERESASKRGYNSAWRRARAGYLRKHPLCVECEKAGRVVAATEVDHIIAHRGDKELFWDSGNWQALCKTHHSRKTARENGWI